MPYRFGVRAGRGGAGRSGAHRGLEAGPQRPVVGRVVGETERAAGTVAGAHVDVLGRAALDLLHLRRIRAELQQRRRLHAAGQLGVGDLVGPGAERARGIDPLDEVGVADPAVVQERGLEDHLGAGAHGVGSGASRGLQPGAGGGVGLDVHDIAPRFLVPGEDTGLVLGAAARQHVEQRIVAGGALDLTSGGGELEVGEVLARSEPGEVARGADELAVKQPHRVLATRVLTAIGPLLQPRGTREGPFRVGTVRRRRRSTGSALLRVGPAG